jgi:hypothetical protein
MRYLFLALMLLEPVFVKAQDISLRLRTNVPGDLHLYTGKTNIIDVANASGSFTVKARHGLIRMLDKNSFCIFEPYRNVPTTDTIIVANRSTTLLQKGYQVVYSEAAFFQLGDLASDTVPRLRARPGLVTNVSSTIGPTFPDLLSTDTAAIMSPSARFRVTGFSIGIKHAHGDYIGPLISYTNKLTSDQTRELNFTTHGDIIYIEDIKWECNGCKTFVHPESLHQRIVLK